MKVYCGQFSQDYKFFPDSYHLFYFGSHYGRIVEASDKKDIFVHTSINLWVVTGLCTG